jgi:uncharacterized NAD-dependent epimerase/dehydratase family protein
MSLEDAVAAGPKTLVVGVANRGGVFSEAWIEVLEQALGQGLDLAAGLHGKLADVPQLAAAAARNGRQLFDVRHPSQTFAVGDGKKRPGKRLLTVGTDCSCGKMYTSLALEREMRGRGMNVEFRATGQSGILIAGDGVSVDAVVGDFISGATEWLSPANDPGHWDVIEGQGSLFHASFAGVSMGLLHGAQPDALVMCHEPTRSHMRGLPDYGLPDLQLCIDTNLTAARLTNPDVRCIGVAVNTSLMEADAARRYAGETEEKLGLPVVDPVRHGVAPLVDQLT